MPFRVSYIVGRKTVISLSKENAQKKRERTCGRGGIEFEARKAVHAPI